MELVLATRNKDKVKEIKKIIGEQGLKLLSLNDFDEFPEVVEDRQTLEENAIKKATETAQFTGKTSLADDSGLEVDALDGAPGVHSARFAGEGRSYQDNNEKLLQLLQNIPDKKRSARFRCVIAIATPEGDIRTVEGVCEGVIARESRGSNGFGYDPVFFIKEYNRTFAELSPEVKNKISHRALALEKAKEILKEMIESK